MPDPDPKAEERQRIEFLRQSLATCDRFLSPLADPRGKRVLAVGCGAGTESVWALSRGARELVGIDSETQNESAARAFLEELGVSPAPFQFLRHAAERADELEGPFDLILSFNTIEHLADPGAVLAACGRVLEPTAGRVAMFADPLYYSSCGSHLEHEPWEHLWGDWEEIRARRAAVDDFHGHYLREHSVAEFIDDYSRLNRFRARDYLDAVARSGLVPLDFGFVYDRNLDRLAEHLPRLVARSPREVTPLDFAVEGIWFLLAPATAITGVEAQSHGSLSPMSSTVRPLDPLNAKPRRPWWRRRG